MKTQCENIDKCPTMQFIWFGFTMCLCFEFWSKVSRIHIMQFIWFGFTMCLSHEFWLKVSEIHIMPDSYTVAPLHRRLPVTNKSEARLPYYGALFSETEECYCFPCSSIVYRLLMFSTSYFKSSLSTISIKSVNAMPLWNFSQSHFEVVLKIMTIAELFIVMTTSPG